MDIKEDEILKDNIHHHWYYISKGRAMRKFLNQTISNKVTKILDIGAGSGIFSCQLLDNNLCDSAICIDPNYDKESVKTHNGKEIHFVRHADNDKFKLLLMMDVLEHVQDDVSFLKSYINNLDKDGYIFISVPAFQFMWSGHDVFLEHYRRYTLKKLENVISTAGLTPVKTRYFFGSLFPIIAMIRLIKKVLFRQGKLTPQSDLKVHSKTFNDVLTKVHDIERTTIFSFNKFFGLSVFCVCQKQ